MATTKKHLAVGSVLLEGESAFCDITVAENCIVVRPTRIGSFLRRTTFGFIRPRAVFYRDFGPGSADGKSLIIEGDVVVTVAGNITGYDGR